MNNKNCRTYLGKIIGRMPLVAESTEGLYRQNDYLIGRNMNWNTIYIRGRYDFREDVNRRLEHSRLRVMPGSLGTSEEAAEMYWVAEHTSLKEFKKAIGARMIWKYRLRFYTCLEEFIEAKYVAESAVDDATPEQEDIMPGLPAIPDRQES